MVPFLVMSRLGKVALVFCIVTLLTAALNAQVEWRPVTPAEMAMKEPKVEKDADAEAIFWETKMDDRKLSKLTISHYVRLKIFTERGREKFSKVDIPFMKGKKIEDVAARVIKPDGSIVDLQPSDIFDREVAKVGKARFMAKSFAVPGIEPGVIVEYQYVETIKDDSVTGERLRFQRDIPMQQVTYRIRPYGKSSLSYDWFNLPETRFRDDPANKGYQIATMYDVPAYKDEPYMPPDDEVRKWAFVSYMSFQRLLVWNNVATGWDVILKALTKSKKEVKQLATQITAGATTDEERLRRLYSYCQNEIRNISYDRSLTDDQRDEIKIKDADDVLKRKMGSSLFIDLLFASLAKSLDFETTLALTSDRSENFFEPQKYPFSNFIEPSGIGVKIGNKWTVYSPGVPYLAFGQVPWYREDAKMMLVGDGGFLWTKLPLSEAEKSTARRKGKFKLDEDGTLEGTVTMEFDGHQALGRRREEYRDSDAKREENLKDEIKAKMSTAEVTSMSIQNFDDPSKPLIYQFNIRVPNYAQKAGRRLIFQPVVFEKGSAPVFSTDTRTYDVHIPYPWSEKDEVELSLPANYEIESGETPGELADPGKIGLLSIAASVDKVSNKLTLKRNFSFGREGAILFPVDAYPAVKRLFDAFHQADTFSLVLKPKAN